MLKTDLVVETVGEPDISALSENEQNAFFESLYDSIIDLYEQSLTQQD